jgi:hypothetical protein
MRARDCFADPEVGGDFFVSEPTGEQGQYLSRDRSNLLLVRAQLVALFLRWT